MTSTAPSSIGGRHLGAKRKRSGRFEPIAHQTAVLAHAGRVVRFVAGTFSVFALTLGAGLALLALVPAVASRWEPVVITSGSMEPSIRPGDIVLAQPMNTQSVGAGTVVVFDDPQRGGLVTHRVAHVNADGTFTTKGDANQSRDSQPVESSAIRGAGRLVVPAIGRPLVWARQGQWINLMMLSGATLGCLYTSRFGFQARFDPWLDRP